MLDGFTRILGAAEEESLSAGGSTLSKLIDGEALTAGRLNAGTSSGSEPQSSDGDLGDREKTGVVGDLSNHNNGLLRVVLCVVLGGSIRNNTRDRDRRS